MQNFIRRWRAIWQPDMYHGWGRSKSYFEGWYFKIVDATEGSAFAFIPGISMGQNGEQHAFIQVFDGKRCTSEYIRFNADAFKPSEENFDIQLAGNQFSAKKMTLHLPNIKGQLTFENTTPWPKMLGAPGIMGWYSFVPFMQCYHGIVSLNHTITGSLNINGQDVNFTGGKGYIEKDWGESFPRGWIWLQTNHFNDENMSLIASVAHIPFLGSHFIGYIVGFWFRGKLYRFASYTGAKMNAEIVDNQIFLRFKDAKNHLDIIATKAGTGSLIAPLHGDMTGKVNESLQAVIEVKFYEKGKLIFEGKGRNAGLEAAGEVDVLLNN